MTETGINYGPFFSPDTIPSELNGAATRRSVIAGMIAGWAIPSHALSASRVRTIAPTRSGHVAGRREQGVDVFRGIPYAASTGGENRFRPPLREPSWSGIRDCSRPGPSAPQLVSDAPHRAAFAAVERLDEDCLNISIFTPEASDRRTRPVMVWFHGGGWRTGAGSAPGLQGHRLARQGDIVLVTVNHRLDLMGFLHIADGDERFADSGNLGVLDMVAALSWVRDNIAAFGGDPSNVTIFGQSGGGSKVAALLGCESAKGLFHKAIAMSCSGCLRLAERDEAEAIAAAVAVKLGQSRLKGEELQKLPLGALVAAAQAGCRPIIDGRTFARHPFDPDAVPSAKGIPLLAGNVENETRLTLLAGGMANFSIDKAEATRRLGRFFSVATETVDAIYSAYAQEYPLETPAGLLAAITGDYTYVRNTRRLADLQSAHAPVFTYMFTHRSPVLNGLLGSPHESDVPFVFGTTEAARNMVGFTSENALLTDLMIQTWATFARTGTPSNALLPSWPKHKPGSPEAMLLDLVPQFGTIRGDRARLALTNLPWYEYRRPVSYNRP